MISWVGHQKHRHQKQNKHVGLHQNKKLLCCKGNKIDQGGWGSIYARKAGEKAKTKNPINCNNI